MTALLASWIVAGVAGLGMLVFGWIAPTYALAVGVLLVSALVMVLIRKAAEEAEPKRGKGPLERSRTPTRRAEVGKAVPTMMNRRRELRAPS
jgi:membrane protein implicated in regulation of membrane protease activity